MDLEEFQKYIPDKIKISGKDCQVVARQDRNEEDGADSSGSYSHWYSKIWLSYGDRSFDCVMCDLLHEIIEAIDKENDLRLNHQTITTMGTLLHQILRDNKLKFFREE